MESGPIQQNLTSSPTCGKLVPSLPRANVGADSDERSVWAMVTSRFPETFVTAPSVHEHALLTWNDQDKHKATHLRAEGNLWGEEVLDVFASSAFVHLAKGQEQHLRHSSRFCARVRSLLSCLL